jgi:hypothetical protein
VRFPAGEREEVGWAGEREGGRKRKSERERREKEREKGKRIELPSTLSPHPSTTRPALR